MLCKRRLCRLQQQDAYQIGQHAGGAIHVAQGDGTCSHGKTAIESDVYWLLQPGAMSCFVRSTAADSVAHSSIHFGGDTKNGSSAL